MREFVRAMVIPFFMPLFPAVWYINRNVMAEQLPPRIEPTTELGAISIGVAVFASTMFATVIALFRDQNETDDQHELPYRKRVFQPDDTALVIFFVFIAVSFVGALVEMGGFGPAWLEEPLYVLLGPLGLPLLVLAPFAIRFHWAVVLGLVLCVLWMSLLGNVVSDIIHHRPLPLLNT